jgi:hypothetical protein
LRGLSTPVESAEALARPDVRRGRLCQCEGVSRRALARPKSQDLRTFSYGNTAEEVSAIVSFLLWYGLCKIRKARGAVAARIMAALEGNQKRMGMIK